MHPLLALLAALSAAAPAGAQEVYPSGMMEWTTRAGRGIAAYHAALETARGAIRADPATAADSIPPLYAAGPYEGGWAVSFGALEGDTAFILSHGVMIGADGAVTRVDRFTRRRPASPHHTRAARALARVMDDFRQRREAEGFTAPGYRFAVLPASGGGATVFVSPARIRAGATLAGSDQMYSVSGPDFRITRRTRFHRAVIEIPRDAPPGGTAILFAPSAPGPSPADIAVAVEWGAPLLVAARGAVYRIEGDGTLAILPEDDPQVRAVRAGTP